jgi:hypothetical protein
LIRELVKNNLTEIFNDQKSWNKIYSPESLYFGVKYDHLDTLYCIDPLDPKVGKDGYLLRVDRENDKHKICEINYGKMYRQVLRDYTQEEAIEFILNWYEDIFGDNENDN